MYRKDRKKGGGGIVVYFASLLPSKQLRLPRSYSAIKIEAIATESNSGKQEVAVLGLCRPPKASGTDYHIRLEDELNEVVSWLSLPKQFIVITDLNLNRLRSYQREGKIMRDFEDVRGVKCQLELLIQQITFTRVSFRVLLSSDFS